MAFMMIVLAAISAESYAAMSLSDIRRESRFLTDRMGHELGLSNRQYNDVYEINFDFLYQVNEVIDDVVYGYDDAIDYYYYLLDMRNEDLMYVLRSSQYRRFVNRDYFYRPIYMVGHTWGMRIWSRYTDRNYYYFSIPTCYHTYIGAHYRIHFAHSYYADRYNHKLYHGAFRLWGGGYKHHHHDGWLSIGKRKHEHGGSRPWSNAKNYEKSRRDLKNGYVSVPSRDKNKRIVKFNSEENRRTAVTSSTPSRTGSSRAVSTNSSANNRSTSTTGRNGSATTTRRNEKNSASTSRSNSSASPRANASSVSSSRSNSSNSSVSRNASSGTSRSSSVSRSNSNASRSNSVSRSSSNSTSRSSVSGSRSASSQSSASSRSSSRSSASTSSRSSSSSSSRSR